MNKKNKKGASTFALGGLVIMAIMVIVCAALLPQIFQNQAVMTNTVNFTGTITTGAASVAQWVTGQELITTPISVNVTATQNCANNVTYAEGINPTTGLKGISMTPVATWTTAACTVMNVSYLYGASGYVDDAGGRTVAGTIGLFAALALLCGVIYLWYVNYGKELFGF